MENKIDETIINICNWINTNIEDTDMNEYVIEAIKALAELVSARAM